MKPLPPSPPAHGRHTRAYRFSLFDLCVVLFWNDAISTSINRGKAITEVSSCFASLISIYRAFITIMSGSTQIMKEFETPDRNNKLNHSEEKKEVTPHDTASEMKASGMAKPNTVTPPEAGSREDPSAIKKEPTDVSPLQMPVDGQVDSPEDGNKQVRFDGDAEETKKDSLNDSPSSSSSSQRGLVSRRGGRCGSPGRMSSKVPSTKETVLEFKTYRSPSRGKRDETDTIPSLCSANSGEQREKNGTNEEAKDSIKVKLEDKDDEADDSEADKKPSSIACNSALIENTSPLASDGVDHAQDARSSKTKVPKSRQESAQQSRKNNVTFSPQPPSKKEIAERVSTRLLSSCCHVAPKSKRWHLF